MKRLTIYIAITNHGYGHTTRTAAIANTIQKLCPDVLLILTTTAPRWLIESYIQGDFILRQRALDLGIIQSDSLTMDKAATWEKLRDIQHKSPSIISSEVNFIQQNRVDLILADIPFLASALAKMANIPCWMISNFGWDFIYRDWGGQFTEIADWISEWYSKSDRLFRLPFHEPMAVFSNIKDVGLTGGDPHISEDEIRQKWSIKTPPERTILLTFGGLSLDAIPYHNLSKFPDWQFITFDQKAPNLPNLIKINDFKYRPVDIMPICNKIISKPGYSTFSEATKLQIPIVTIPREDFAESAILLTGITNYSHHQIITAREFFQGDWEFIHHIPNPPKQPDKISKDGNETIAQSVINYLM